MKVEDFTAEIWTNLEGSPCLGCSDGHNRCAAVARRFEYYSGELDCSFGTLHHQPPPGLGLIAGSATFWSSTPGKLGKVLW
jgi:hypothetical protein